MWIIIGIFMVVAGAVNAQTVCDDRPLADWYLQGADRYERTSVRVLTTNGGRLDWGTDGVVYFDRRPGLVLNEYDIWKMDIETGEETCLTCDHPDLEGKSGASRGQPELSPNADWMIFQAEHPNHALTSDPNATQPGKGIYNNLWAMNLKTGKADLVYEVSDGKWLRPKGGTLHPQWSHDGRQIVWGDLQNLCIGCGVIGNWQIRTAEFWVIETVPVQAVLLDHELFNPFIQGNGHWYETHDWGRNGELVLYSGNTMGQLELFSDINYNTLEQLREGCEPIRLTETSGRNGEPWEFDEHAHFTQKHDAISWLRAEIGVDRGELWMMNPDGSGKRQITFFNTPGSEEYMLTGGEFEANVPSDHAWNPMPTSGKAQLAVFVQIDFQLMQNEAPINYIYLLEFDLN